MTELVRVHRRNAGVHAPTFEYLSDPDRLLTLRTEPQHVEFCLFVLTAGANIAAQGISRLGAIGQALARSSFGGTASRSLTIEVIHVQPGQFASSHSSIEEKADDRVVAPVLKCVALG